MSDSITNQSMSNDGFEAILNDEPINEIKEAQSAATKNDEVPRVRLESYADMKAWKPSARWLIKNYIPAGAMGCFFGEPESKKTFAAIDAAIAVSMSSVTHWHGQEVERHGPVVYLSGEGNLNIRSRIIGAVEYHRQTNNYPEFYLYPAAVSFDKGGAAEVVAELKRLNLKPVLFIVDTLRRYLDGDENDSKSIAQFFDGLESLKADESTFLIISHPGNGKESKDRVRGSSSLRGAFDFEVKISTDSRGFAVLQSTKMKDAERPKNLILEPVQIIVDGLYEEDGTPASTLAFKNEAAMEQQSTKRAKASLNARQQAFLQSFRKAAAIEGELDDNGNFIGLHVDKWRPYAYATDWADTQAAKKTAFDRGRTALIEKGCLTVKNNFYRLAGDMAEIEERQFAEKLKLRPPKQRQLLIGAAENDSATAATLRNTPQQKKRAGKTAKKTVKKSESKRKTVKTAKEQVIKDEAGENVVNTENN